MIRTPTPPPRPPPTEEAQPNAFTVNQIVSLYNQVSSLAAPIALSLKSIVVSKRNVWQKICQLLVCSIHNVIVDSLQVMHLQALVNTKGPINILVTKSNVVLCVFSVCIDGPNRDDRSDEFSRNVCRPDDTNTRSRNCS